MATKNINHNVPYTTNNICYHQYKINIIDKLGYCCNNQCSSEPCLTNNIVEENKKWCLYDKFCANNINSPKYMISIKHEESCAPHPFGKNINIVYTENEAILWMSVDNECE
jgi:hypothetical protein